MALIHSCVKLFSFVNTAYYEGHGPTALKLIFNDDGQRSVNQLGSKMN